MRKLFITPEHGKLGSTLDKLRQADYQAHIVGFGYPPMYVEAEESQIDEIKSLIEGDGRLDYKDYRTDIPGIMDIDEWAKFVTTDDLFSILDPFRPAEFTQVCLKVGVQEVNLSGYPNLPTMKASLVADFQANKKLTVLIKAVNEMKPDLVGYDTSKYPFEENKKRR